MKGQALHVIILMSILSLMGPIPAHAVQTHQQAVAKEKKELADEKKMDALSLAAYVSAMAGIASFFVVPAASIALLPAAFIMGLIALLSGKKRYLTKRGRGLALTATILGGTFTLFVFASFIAFSLFGF